MFNEALASMDAWKSCLLLAAAEIMNGKTWIAKRRRVDGQKNFSLERNWP